MLLKIITLAFSLATLATAFVEPQDACAKSSQGCPYDCSPKSKDGLQIECWDFLNMTGYINEWVEVHGKEANIAEKGFAQAYLAYNGENEKTCNLITSDTCSAPTADGQVWVSYQQYYTLYNIFAVYQFFNQYSTALTSSQALAAAKLGQIVNMTNPPVEHALGDEKWTTALTTTLLYFSFFWAPSTFIPAEGKVAVYAVNQVLGGIWAAFKTPPLGKIQGGYTQTAQTRFSNLAKVGSELAGLVVNYQKLLLSEVQAMQDNVDSFIALCSPGGFSQRVTISSTDQSLEIYKSLELFVLSQSLNASGVVITKSVGIDPRTVPHISCPGFGPAGNCYNWWYDAENHNTYAFDDPQSSSRDFTDLINYIWDEKIVDDMSQIFRNEACVGKDVPDVLALDDPPDPDNGVCYMTNTNCEYFYSDDFAVQKAKQFSNCPNDRKFLRDCHTFYTEGKYVVPLSYLGPYMASGKFCRD